MIRPLTLWDLSLPTVPENLALDEALLLELEEGQGTECLRLWEATEYSIVLGASGSIVRDVHEQACLDSGVAIWRRPSGGGTVLLGPGCLMYSLILRFDHAPGLRDVHGSYRWILERMAAILAPIQPGLKPAGISDLAAATFKCSGNAQQRKSQAFLHHGTLLYGFDVPRIEKYLRMPEKQPDYRQAREHGSFVRNLPTSADQLRALLIEGWQATIPPGPLPRERIERLLAERYQNPTWIRRR